MEKLAISGGEKSVTIPRPHEIWPPKGNDQELNEIARQRNIDIGIKGKSGPIKDFEELFRDFLEGSVKYQVSFNSGTSALFAAYFAIGLQDGDELIGPALTYHAALSPAYVLKANVVLVDVDPHTRCIDASRIERSITEKTRAITVVHQWGHPADMDQIMTIAKKHNLKVVEDCSHAHGSRYKGKMCGTFGDVAIFSLQTNKAIFAGEGGILVTNNEEIHNRATLLGHYRDRSREEIRDEEYRKYWVTGFGLKLRMSPFNAIVAKLSLARFPELKSNRHKCLKYFNERLAEISYIEPLVIALDVDMGAWYGFKPLYKKEKLHGISRERLIEILNAEGVEISDPSGPMLSTQPLYSETNSKMYPSFHKKANDPILTPVAEMIQDCAVSFPTFSNYERDKDIIDQYIDAMKKVGHNVNTLVDA